jgi:Lrp/AsnC family leucine-responsive transcriptional regulator
MQKKTLQLDDLDKKIIKSLIMNSRKSSRQLSKEVKVSHQTILSRLKNLEESKIVQSYTTVVDWEKLGYPLRTMFLIECGKLDQKNFDSIEKYLNGEDSFIQFGALHGEYDYFIVGQFRNEREISDKATALRTFLSKQVDLKKFGHHAIWKFNQKQNQDL